MSQSPPRPMAPYIVLCLLSASGLVVALRHYVHWLLNPRRRGCEGEFWVERGFFFGDTIVFETAWNLSGSLALFATILMVVLSLAWRGRQHSVGSDRCARVTIAFIVLTVAILAMTDLG